MRDDLTTAAARLAALVGVPIAEAILDAFREELADVASTIEPASRWLTVEQTAKYLGTTPKAIRRRIERGRLRAVRDGRRVYVDRQALDEAFAARGVRSGRPHRTPPHRCHGRGHGHRRRSPMTTESSHGARTREPVYLGQRRIPNLWQRTLANGDTAFEFVGRVDGRVTFRRLSATTKSEAVTEARGLTTDRDRGELRIRPTAPTMPSFATSFSTISVHSSATRTTAAAARKRASTSTSAISTCGSCPSSARRRVDEITTADLRRWLDKLRRTNLAPNTQRGVLTAASAMLRYAAKQGNIPMTPAAGLDRDDRPSTARKRQPRYLNGAQLGALLGKLDDDYRPLGSMLAYAGLRVSEALAVRWRDVDLDTARLTVAAQLDRGGRTVPLKTTASAATVDLLPALVRELRAHRARQAALGIHLVRADALAFITPNRESHTISAARYEPSRPAATAANLGHVTAHDLRHSLVANALDAGLTLAEAARLARHASPAVTASVYADVLEANRETLGAKLAQAGFGA